MRNRIEEIDIIKAICIIGIVFAHAGHALGWVGYFYVYGFYFVAGATWRDKSFPDLLISRIKRIYMPFVISNLIIEIICVFLHKFTNYDGGTFHFPSYISSILAFDLKESIMAPSWFLLPLFCFPFLFFS